MRRTALWSTRGLLIALVAWAGLSSGVAWAQTAPPGVGSFSGSPDVTVALPTATLADEGVGRDELSSLGLSVPVDLGPLPPSADVTAYHLLSGGDRLFTLDTSTTLPGPVTVRPGDVVRYDGAGYTIELDAAALGIHVRVIAGEFHVAAVDEGKDGDNLVSISAFPAARGTISILRLQLRPRDLLDQDGIDQYLR